MESIETNTETNTEAPSVTSGSRKLGEYDRKGYRIVTWMNGANYFVEVYEGGQWKMSSPLDGNRGRAERAAELWADEQGKTPADGELPTHEMSVETETSIIGGWKIEIVDGRGGTYNAVISPAAQVAGEVDEPPTIRGYQRKQDALAEATAWAHANPLRLTGWFNGCEWLVLRYLGSNGPGWTFSVTFPTAESGIGLTAGEVIYKTPDDATNEAIGWCSRFKLGEQLPTERAFGEVYPSPAETVAPTPDSVEAVRAHLTVHHDPEGISAHVWLGEEIEVCIKGRLPDFDNEGHHDDAALLDLAATHLHGLGWRATMSHKDGRRLLTSDEGRARAGYDAPAPVAPPPAPVEKAIDEARASGGLQVVEPPPVESHTAELMELLQRKRDLKKQRRQLDAAMASAKSKVKACDDEIAELDAQIDAVLEDERRQVPLPLTSTPAPKLSAKVSAPPPAPVKATAMPRQPIRWTANGVELEIMVREDGPERFAAKVAGLAGTDGFGETWEQAVEAAKVAASVVLADCDPGETTPKADTGPVADGPRLPPKRGGRKPKLKGKIADEVTAVLRGSMTLDEAAKTIGCSTAELEGWARAADFQLSKHLGAGDEPAPKASKKPRGGKRGKK